MGKESGHNEAHAPAVHLHVLRTMGLLSLVAIFGLLLWSLSQSISEESESVTEVSLISIDVTLEDDELTELQTNMLAAGSDTERAGFALEAARRYVALGQNELARTLLERTLSSPGDIDLATIHVRIAESYEAEGNIEAAISSYHSARAATGDDGLDNSIQRRIDNLSERTSEDMTQLTGEQQILFDEAEGDGSVQ